MTKFSRCLKDIPKTVFQLSVDHKPCLACMNMRNKTSNVFLFQLPIRQQSMRFTLTLTCLTTIIIAVSSTNPEENNYNNNHNHQRDHILEPLNVAADRETITYLLPRLAAKYRPNEEWSQVMDPKFYILSEMDNDVFDEQVSRSFNCRMLAITFINCKPNWNGT